MPDACNSISDRHAREAAAANECVVPDARHTVRNCHAREAAAARECETHDARHTASDRHTREAAAVLECSFPEARHTVRDRYARETAAGIERIIPDARHTRRDRHTREAEAGIERSIPDARHTRRDRHTREAVAARECVIPDGGDGMVVYLRWYCYGAGHIRPIHMPCNRSIAIIIHRVFKGSVLLIRHGDVEGHVVDGDIEVFGGAEGLFRRELPLARRIGNGEQVRIAAPGIRHRADKTHGRENGGEVNLAVPGHGVFFRIVIKLHGVAGEAARQGDNRAVFRPAVKGLLPVCGFMQDAGSQVRVGRLLQGEGERGYGALGRLDGSAVRIRHRDIKAVAAHRDAAARWCALRALCPLGSAQLHAGEAFGDRQLRPLGENALFRFYCDGYAADSLGAVKGLGLFSVLFSILFVQGGDGLRIRVAAAGAGIGHLALLRLGGGNRFFPDIVMRRGVLDDLLRQDQRAVLTRGDLQMAARGGAGRRKDLLRLRLLMLMLAFQRIGMPRLLQLVDNGNRLRDGVVVALHQIGGLCLHGICLLLDLLQLLRVEGGDVVHGEGVREQAEQQDDAQREGEKTFGFHFLHSSLKR